MANGFTKCCKAVKHFPSRFLCLCFHFLQAGILDYYLVTYKGKAWLACIAADVVVAIVLCLCFFLSYRHLNRAKSKGGKETDQESASLLFVPISWFAYSTLLAIKVGIAFKDFVFLLSEDIFFGPNTLKTTIALGGVIFALLLSTNHDAKPGSPRRKYIDELTGTVIFDILDCVDSMEILFFKEERDTFPTGMDDAIIGIALINFILPTIPLITLSKTKYGEAKLSHKLVMIHKVLLAFVVNLPLLITRMILWHGLSRGISIFSLKNVIVIGMISFDLYETLEGGENEQTENNNDGVTSSGQDGLAVESYAMEDRFNYMD
ncbi:Hypothetical predicted protein [Mytilus galloprovincialis]|uniref:Uncharacterized protein n=1 Tax=Mytilus galloprovincialis TaxID=29158 RepID=A0A8B6CAL5_MYTGA|nr:Hypothetical predicted protein [Mytilus galloprovincialis]